MRALHQDRPSNCVPTHLVTMHDVLQHPQRLVGRALGVKGHMASCLITHGQSLGQALLEPEAGQELTC